MVLICKEVFHKLNLAFYYHIPASLSKEGAISLPGFLGVFVEALANAVDQLFLVAHTLQTDGEYTLTSPNIKLIDLGKKTPAWHRHLFHKKILSSLRKELQNVDIFLVRSPTPLGPFFDKYIPSSCMIKYYIVGSYESGASEMDIKSLRQWLIRLYLQRNHKEFLKRLNGKKILVNSPQLKNEYEKFTKKVDIIPTTTLSENDFFSQRDRCTKKDIHLLYTGRFDFQKGLVELIDAFYHLRKKYENLVLNLVGWDDSPGTVVETALNSQLEKLGLSEYVIWHGRKRVGPELWLIYRQSDIYLIPSYHEGFPRTIWEAMANSLPVIATRVGAIPYYLKHKESAFLIEPKSVKNIVDATDSIITDKAQRQLLIKNAFELSRENTLENRSQQVVDIIKQDLKHE